MRADLLPQPFGLALVILFLRLFDERHDVAHSQDPLRDAIRVERGQRVELLSHRRELDGLVDDGANRESRAASRVSIELGEHDAVVVELPVELERRVDGVLPRHAVDHEENFIRIDGLLDGGHLLHHALVDVEPTGRIDDDHVPGRSPGLDDGFRGDAYGVLHGLAVFQNRVHGYLDRIGQRPELVDGCRTIDVGGGQQRRAPLPVKIFRQLGAEGRLARPLEARHKNDRGRVLCQLDIDLLVAEEMDQFVVDELDELFAGRDGREHVLAKRLLLDAIGEVACDLIVHVRIQQRSPNLAHRIGDIQLVDSPLAAYILQRTLKLL